jgi:uncharacterized protein
MRENRCIAGVRVAPSSVMRLARSLLAVLLLLLAVPAVSGAQSSKQIGYIPLPDGVELRYTLLLPEGEGPFPTLMQYEGYQAGSNPARATQDEFIPRMLAKGYAVLGVSLRGSACSDGVWELFGEQQAKDGAFAVEWAAKQSWSNGKVATFGYSYGGIMQLWIAAMQPKGLVAATPSNVVADTYRDIGYPGGIFNNVFPPAWGVALQADWALAAATAATEGDSKCVANVARNAVEAVPNALAVKIPQHPFDDAWHREHSPGELAERIEVPVLAVRTWQDEETGGRQDSWWEKTDPEKTWLVSSPGNHLVYSTSTAIVPELEAFFDFHVKGIRNGFDRTPRVRIWHETTVKGSNPRSVTTQDRLPAQVGEASLYLGEGGRLGNAPEADGDTDYAYPVESPAVVDTASQGLQDTARVNTWTAVPYLALGRAHYTTPPLAKTVTSYGPSSADLWVSTTAPDVDVQVTVTEVRPDGQEVWVQRGWLRASHRALDEARSTPFTPHHPHTRATTTDMPAGKPQLLRVEIHPFGHTFRKGSSLRIWVEQPSLTGLWGFDTRKTPQTVTVHHGKAHPSRVVLGVLPAANVEADLPSCENLLNLACRANPEPQPSGSLEVVAKAPPSTTPLLVGPKVQARFYGRRPARRGVVVRLRARDKRVSRVVVELRRKGRTVARTAPATVGTRTREVVLRRAGGRPFATGAYSLVVKSGRTVLLRRAVRLGR